MRRSMLALTVCGLLYGCGPAEDGEPIEGSPQPTAPVEVGEAETGTVSELRLFYSNRAGASVTFNSYGDSFTIQDTASDGHSALVQIDATNISECWNAKGVNEVTTCNKNYAEGINIRFRACIGENSTKKVIACAPWTTANTKN